MRRRGFLGALAALVAVPSALKAAPRPRTARRRRRVHWDTRVWIDGEEVIDVHQISLESEPVDVTQAGDQFRRWAPSGWATITLTTFGDQDFPESPREIVVGSGALDKGSLFLLQPRLSHHSRQAAPGAITVQEISYQGRIA